MNDVTPNRTRAEHRARTTTVELDLETVSLGQVRHMVRRLLTQCAGVGVEDAVQVCDELASNAVRHSAPERSCRLIVAGPARFRVEVDDSSATRPRIRRPDGTGGTGLRLVTQLSARWGVEYREAGKTVWAELGTPNPC
ncbi:ATP-binding protein [Nocardia sp. MH4]|uniref:ATP-binding protein n=1 Tax=Nocardia sp. MH4 TaxID=1768677 RepID=UPI001C4F2641|nr:ATP-binding protein [Nocardia sp. MH4]